MEWVKGTLESVSSCHCERGLHLDLRLSNWLSSSFQLISELSQKTPPPHSRAFPEGIPSYPLKQWGLPWASKTPSVWPQGSDGPDLCCPPAWIAHWPLSYICTIQTWKSFFSTLETVFEVQVHCHPEVRLTEINSFLISHLSSLCLWILSVGGEWWNWSVWRHPTPQPDALELPCPTGYNYSLSAFNLLNRISKAVKCVEMCRHPQAEASVDTEWCQIMYCWEGLWLDNFTPFPLVSTLYIFCALLRFTNGSLPVHFIWSFYRQCPMALIINGELLKCCDASKSLQ